MTGIADLPRRVRGIDTATIEVWIAQGWVRPTRQGGGVVFEEIDVARIQLIVELRDELGVGDSAIPVVLSLLDQLHATRTEMRRLCEALEATPEEPVRNVLHRLTRTS